MESEFRTETQTGFGGVLAKVSMLNKKGLEPLPTAAQLSLA